MTRSKLKMGYFPDSKIESQMLHELYERRCRDFKIPALWNACAVQCLKIFIQNYQLSWKN